MPVALPRFRHLGIAPMSGTVERDQNSSPSSAQANTRSVDCPQDSQSESGHFSSANDIHFLGFTAKIGIDYQNRCEPERVDVLLLLTV